MPMATTAAESGQPGVPQAVRSERNKIAAARLRVAVDKQRGVATPQWIRELADGKAN